MTKPKPLSEEDKENLKACLYVVNGELYARYKYSPKTVLDKPIGCVGNHGYSIFRFGGRGYLVHRVIYFLETGVWALGVVDHINGEKLDNRIENLRVTTYVTNSRNYSGGHKNSTSKYRGVSLNKENMKYLAQIAQGVNKYHLGYFDCEKEAALAYNYKAMQLGFPPLSYNQVFKD